MDRILRLALLLIVLLPGTAWAQAWANILAPARATDWSTAGVVGDIPSASWSDCATAACNIVLSGTVTAATIGNAITSAAANTVVRIPNGTFSITAINGTKSDTVLRGSGTTRLNVSNSQSGAGLGGDLSASIHLMSGTTATSLFGGVNSASWTAASYAQGQTTITLSSTTGITAGPVGTGTLIFLDQLNDPADGFPAAGDLFICESGGNGSTCSNQGDANHFGRAGRAQIQAVTVTALAGSVATISPGLRMPNWRASASPGAWWVPTTPPLHNAGIENLTIDFTGQPIGLMVANCVNCWVSGVRLVSRTASSDAAVKHLMIFQAAHVTARSNYLWGKQSDNGFPTDNYAYADAITSDLLVENNIFHHNVIGVVPNDPGTGNVYAYNYGDDSYTFGSSAQLHHFATLALFEGNNFKNVLGDIIHGPHYMVTLFRNHFDRLAHNQSGVVNAAMSAHTNNRFYNFVGNVAGHSAYTRYEQVCPGQAGCVVGSDGDGAAIFVLGTTGSGSCPVPPCNVGLDSNVARTAMRWANWDSVTSTNDTGTNDSTGTRFVNAEVPSGITNFPNPVPLSQALPPSFYRGTTPPTWWGTPFGTPPWPAIGPDVSNGSAPNTATVPTGGHANKIPARLCFENSGPDPGYAGTSPQVRLFNPSTCYLAPSGSLPAAPSNLTITQ